MVRAAGTIELKTGGNMHKLQRLLGILAITFGVCGTASAASIGIVPDNGCLEYGGVYFCDADIQPTGTGVFNPFLRTNPGGGLNPSSGWNTGANKPWAQPNDADDSWTSALSASTLGTSANPVTGNGSYAVFTVDINQEGQPGADDSKLSLLQFQLFNCTSATYTSLASPGCTSFLNVFGGQITYDANDRPIITGSTDWVDFDYKQTSSGSGAGDINVFVPFNLFAGTTNIALLDGWGTSGTVGSFVDNDGFQEWKAQLGTQTCPDGSTPGPGGNCDIIVTPEPASLLLFGLAGVGSAYRMRRRHTGV
jgi:hypothetical protein